MIRAMMMIDVMVAAAVVMVLLVAFLHTVPLSLRAIRRADERLQATSIAQAVIERSRALPLASLTPGEQRLSAQEFNGTRYFPKVTVSYVHGDDARLVSVRVTVRWRGGDAAAEQDCDIFQELWLTQVGPSH